MKEQLQFKIEISKVKKDNIKLILIPSIFVLPLFCLIWIMNTRFLLLPYFIVPFIIIFVLSTITYLIILNSKKTELNITEKDILRILISFLKEFGKTDDEIKKAIDKLFIDFSEFINHYPQYNYFFNFINIEPCLKRLSALPSSIRYYTIYKLLTLSSDDNILTVKEDEFISDIKNKLKIHDTSYNYIKKTYFELGLKEERKIIEEQRRKDTAKKLSKSFLPYNAYKILGVSPSITKSQLKKVYRTLAKKYHPDKYYGQSEEVIQKAEDKFQEILEAYEIIKKHRKLS